MELLKLVFIHLLFVPELNLCFGFLFSFRLDEVLMRPRPLPRALRGCHLMLIIVVLQVETDALPTFMPVCLSLGLLVIDVCACRWLASLHIGLVFSLPVHLIQFLPHVCKFCDETTLGRNVDIHRAVDVGDLVLGPANFSVDLAVRLACSLLVGSVSL